MLTVAGANGTEDLIHTVFAIIEAIAQHPTILHEYHTVIIDNILCSLAYLISSSLGKPAYLHVVG